jgi:hypothetical protein
MTHSPTSRSGRPFGAAGPLVSLLVGLLTVVGLGCAAVGVLPSSAADIAVSAVGPPPDRTARLESLELRRTAEPAPEVAARQPAPPVAEPAPAPLPEIPVVDAAPRSQRSARAVQPARLRIDRADLDVEIRPTGVAEDGSMQLPETIRRAGWYRFGSTPSDPTGTTVIAAHVDTRSEGLGPFARLTSVRRGERIVITDRAGDEHAYRVSSRRHVARTRLPVDDLFDRDGPPRLVVLTCGGAYDARNGYHDNIVVIAEPDR